MIEEIIRVPLTKKAQQRALNEGYTLEPHEGHFRNRYVMGVRPYRYVGPITQCIKAAAFVFGLTQEELLGDARQHCRARWAAMWIARKRGYSLERIGTVMNRHHTTVMHGLQRCEEIQSKDMGYRRACERLLESER